MNKALFFKEWLKTRRVFVLAIVAGIILAVYAVAGIRRIEMSKGVEHVWMIMLLKDQTFVDVLRYFPLLAGIVLALAQFVPEMIQRRFKLTLHLPCSQSKLVGFMILTGIAELAAIFIIQLLIVGIYYSSIINPPLVWHVILTVLPWMVCGMSAYLFVAAICIESSWRMRIILSLIAVATIAVYFKQNIPEAYNGFLIPLAVCSSLSVLLVFRSVARFKEGTAQ